MKTALIFITKLEIIMVIIGIYKTKKKDTKKKQKIKNYKNLNVTHRNYY